jgi:alkylation response protein AidB-like acyl-CoA dehydrogenase
MLREFVQSEVEPQALEHNRKEQFNVALFRQLGDLGLLGITVDPQYGGSGMDAVAAVWPTGACTRKTWPTSSELGLSRLFHLARSRQFCP